MDLEAEETEAEPPTYEADLSLAPGWKIGGFPVSTPRAPPPSVVPAALSWTYF